MHATDTSQKEQTELMKCSKCEKGILAIRFSPRFKKSFIACNAYPECKTTFSLPPGLIKRTDKVCDCGFPLLLRIQKNISVIPAQAGIYIIVLLYRSPHSGTKACLRRDDK